MPPPFIHSLVINRLSLSLMNFPAPSGLLFPTAMGKCSTPPSPNFPTVALQCSSVAHSRHFPPFRYRWALKRSASLLTPLAPFSATFCLPSSSRGSRLTLSVVYVPCANYYLFERGSGMVYSLMTGPQRNRARSRQVRFEFLVYTQPLRTFNNAACQVEPCSHCILPNAS